MATEEQKRIWKAGYDAFNRGDLDEAVKGFDPDIEWDFSALPDGTAIRGIDELREYWASLEDTWEEFTVDVEEDLAGDGADVTLIRLHSKARTTGIVIDAPAALVWQVIGDKVRRVTLMLDRDAALHAAGLER